MRKTSLKFVSIMKKYGPGFVAISEKTGKVLASGHDIQKMYSDAENKGVDFSKVVISHVPKYGSLSLYWRG
jgi:hypothetical protein